MKVFRTDLSIANPVTGVLTGAGHVSTGDQDWWAGVVARDGRIVLSPSKSTKAGIFDPSDAGLQLWDCNDPSTTGRFSGAVVTSTDEVWLVPNSAGDWYRVDFQNRTTTPVGLTASSTRRGWYGATLGGDGWLYPPPDRAGELWRIDPRTGLSQSYGNVPMSDTWAAGALGQDGRIYICPDRASTILVIEPAGNATSVIWYQLPVPSTALAGSGGTSFGSAVTSSDGRTYCIPASGKALLAITPQSSRRLPLDVLLSPHFDKY